MFVLGLLIKAEAHIARIFAQIADGYYIMLMGAVMLLYCFVVVCSAMSNFLFIAP